MDGKYLIHDNFLNITKLGRDGYGIFLDDIADAEIRNNVCVGGGYGIALFWAEDMIVQKNNCSHNDGDGIHLEYVENSLIDRNNCFNNTYGISTFLCSFVNFTSNICYFNGYSEQGDFNEIWETGDGIRIGFSDFCRILNNNCTKNIRSGLSLPGGDFFVVYNNTIKHNRIGIEMQIERSGHLATEIVSGVAIVYNKLINNTEYGVYLSGYVRQSYIHHNIFIHNNIEGTPLGRHSQGPPYGYSQARESTRKRNTWFDKQSNEGNYWSDYQNEGDYLVDGNEYESFNSDPYPIANFSEISIPPIPTFPKGKWFSDRDFFLIRIAFSIAGIICIPISLIVISMFIAKARKKGIEKRNE
ncbi:MAG: hypothetical protein HGN29_12435 [Asgard group archaeon]|nr:hypothetical protein [Asgard group archaeon]